MTPSLVVFGEDWGAHPSSTQHLVQRLSDRHATVWINSIGLRRPRLSGQDMKRVARKMWGYARGRRRTAPRFQNSDPATAVPGAIVDPIGVPVPQNGLKKWLNRRTRGKTFTWKHFEALLARHSLLRPYIAHSWAGAGSHA